MSRTVSASTRIARAAGEQLVVRVAGDQLRRDGGRLLIGGRADDEPVDVLEAPTVVHQLDGEPVEQFGMRRRLALRAEVLGGATRPVPKYACQMRLTIARAVVGERRSTSQRAKSRPVVGDASARRERVQKRRHAGRRPLRPA